MKKFAVGVSDMFEDIEVVIVEAETEVDAICIAVWQKYQWDLKGEEEFEEIQNLDDLVTLALQGDVLVSKPLLLS